MKGRENETKFNRRALIASAVGAYELGKESLRYRIEDIGNIHRKFHLCSVDGGEEQNGEKIKCRFERGERLLARKL